jgi:carbon monoxide dehydrogenase subunit G
VELSADAFEATIFQRLEEEDGGTRLSAVIETTYTGFAARILSGLVTRHAQKQLEGDLDRLKALVESERPAAAGT